MTVRSALNPVLWLCAIVTLPLATFGAYVKSAFLEWISAIPVFMAAVGFLYLLIFDRDKLQSEDFQIRKRTLEIASEKGGRRLDLTKVKVIPNPQAPPSTGSGTGHPLT